MHLRNELVTFITDCGLLQTHLTVFSTRGTHIASFKITKGHFFITIAHIISSTPPPSPVLPPDSDEKP